MRSAMAVLLGLAFVISGPCLAQSLTAEQILAKVSQTYRGFTSFRFVERFESTKWCVGCPAEYETDLAVSTPGKIRLVVSSRKGKTVLVSDARETWAYIPSLNEYMEAAAAPLLQELWAHPGAQISDGLAPYRALSLEAGRAKLRGEGTLNLEGKKVRCYILDVSGLRRLWVDEQRFIVLRDRWIVTRSFGDIGDMHDLAYMTTAVWISGLTKADLGPIPDDVFQFVVPSGTRRVDSFTVQTVPTRRAEVELAGFLIGWKMWSASRGEEYLLQGSKAPDFTIPSLGGEDVRLHALQGKIVVLEFWASWCEPCQEELAAIQKLHDELASKGVVFLGVDDERPETIRAFVKEKGYTFPMLLDPEETFHELYGVRLVPTRVVIDRNGKIVDKYIGAGGEAQLRRALKSAGLDTTP